tara:strand:- start:9245 stop:9415 length:171 start_codon:yes stop_codon:yes gene_type:complete
MTTRQIFITDLPDGRLRLRLYADSNIADYDKTFADKDDAAAKAASIIKRAIKAGFK